jgi:hypothetical protein
MKFGRVCNQAVGRLGLRGQSKGMLLCFDNKKRLSSTGEHG